MAQPEVEQTHFRWESPDVLMAGTQLGTEDVRNASLSADTTYYIRIKLKCITKNYGAFTGRLEYNVGAGWNNVTTTSSYVKCVSGPTADGTSTSERLTNDGGSFIAGEYDESGLAGSVTLNIGETEMVYAVQIVSADFSAGTTNIDLRVTDNGTAFNTYTEQDAASFTVASTGHVSKLAGQGGLAGAGGLAGRSGGLAG